LEAESKGGMKRSVMSQGRERYIFIHENNRLLTDSPWDHKYKKEHRVSGAIFVREPKERR
jgi:hypothetical protein